MSKRSIILHLLANNAPLNSQEIYDKTHELTGQNKNSQSVTLAELKRADLIERNQHSRYQLTDQGIDWVDANPDTGTKAKATPTHTVIKSVKKEPEPATGSDTKTPGEEMADDTIQENIDDANSKDEDINAHIAETDTDPQTTHEDEIWPADTGGMIQAQPPEAKLQQIISLAQESIDNIATGSAYMIRPAFMFIDIRDLAQEVLNSMEKQA